MLDPRNIVDDTAEQGSCWFVYLFALSDCSAFKVGFTCNPLQRIFTFSRRYFERFDLDQSLLLRLPSCAEARAIEATLKIELAEVRADSPPWVPLEAGGHTEWFSAVYFGQAEARLRSFLHDHESARALSASQYVHGELQRLSRTFEQWSFAQAQQVCELRSAMAAGHLQATDPARSLRDWLDAYRCFHIPLFEDDREVLEFVVNSARG
jgi:hypothetical protein